MNVLYISNKPVYPIIDGGCFAMAQFLNGLLSNKNISLKHLTITTKKHPFEIKEYPKEIRDQVEPEPLIINTKITSFKALLALIADEDIGDITDVINGWDLVVEQVQGNPYPQTTVRIKPKQTALSDNNDQVDSWLKEQPDPMEVHKPMQYDFVKKQLQKYLDPTATTEEDLPAAGAETTAPAKSDFTLETATTGNQDTVSKFNDLFDE